MAERLQKVLARMGMGSRREIEGWIREGIIKVDGKVAQLGQTDEGITEVDVNGATVVLEKEVGLEVLQYHKSNDEICSRKDPEGRKTVYSNLPQPMSGRWIAVGRLDFTTTGILLFTTDGELANTLMHPSAEVDREYLVRVHGKVNSDTLDRLKKGVRLKDGVARFTDAKLRPSTGTNQWLQVVLQEGRNHEVKRMFESQGLTVTRLIRSRFGPIELDDNLKKNKSRLLTNKEIKALQTLAKYNKK